MMFDWLNFGGKWVAMLYGIDDDFFLDGNPEWDWGL